MKIPYSFIEDALSSKDITVKNMFGCYGVYIDGKIYFFMRKQPKKPELNGIWVAVSNPEHHSSLLKEFPGINNDKKLITEKKSKNPWILISEANDKFEELAIKACSMILKNDERIGKITKGSTTKSKKK